MEVHHHEPGGIGTDTRPELSLQEQVEIIHSSDDFVSFVQALRDRSARDENGWENRDLNSYLEAIAAWVEDMEGYYANRGEPVPAHPDWKLFGEILLAATVYE